MKRNKEWFHHAKKEEKEKSKEVYSDERSYKIIGRAPT
jgi:hypothetical protein